MIGCASALRLILFSSLERGSPYLTYYPAVMLAALYGGLQSGVLATALATLSCAYWIQRGFLSPVEWLMTAVFIITCLSISAIAEPMRRAQTRARQAQEKAEAANRAKSVFLASMSHELRTPLNAVLGFSSLMRNDAGLSGEQRKSLDIINRSGEHLLSLINDVLDMAKIEAGRTSVETAPLDLERVVRGVADLVRVQAGEKGLSLVLDQSPEFPRFVHGDANKLDRVLINLVGNAVNYTQRGGVTLRLNAQPTDVPGGLLLIVEVEDTGIGIAAEDQERIFTSFVRIEGPAARRGTGLGLAIARADVELMGGRVSVESTPGKGSIFRVEIPVEQASESDVAAVEGGRRRVIGLLPGQPEYRILIVEDQMENWLLLQRMLEVVGFQVRVAENGAAGVEVFQEWRPHLIWMDIRMPILDGLEATRRIRALSGGGDVKIVALTASAFKEDCDTVLAAGMDGLVRKPYRPHELFDCLTRQLGVRFVYDSATVAAAPAVALRPEALAALPQELRRDLTGAVVSLDVARIGETIRRVSELDPALGDALAQHADQFAYTTILRALEPASIVSAQEAI
jgi:signal transduction histidine kinase/CheY-like chemotaxis protein